MGPRVFDWSVPYGRRPDGGTWSFRGVSLIGSRPGPSTCFVSGIYGDKPLACQSLVDLVARLRDEDLVGEVHVVPAANLPAIEAGTRANPDGHLLNRRFPGRPDGFLTDQLAHHLVGAVLERSDFIVDVHSGTPTMGLWYTYDFGTPEASASFGYLPVIVGYGQTGQLSHAATAAGATSFLVEFGGGAIAHPAVGVEGCLNVLRYREQVGGVRTGPPAVPRITDRQLCLASANGALWGRYGTDRVGSTIEAGPVAEIRTVTDGSVLEQFSADRDGWLLMTVTTPAAVTPGSFAAMIGYGSDLIEVPVP